MVGFPAVRRSPIMCILPRISLREGLKEAGFVEPQNVAIEFRYAEGRGDRLPELVADLIHKPAAVIVANNPSAVVAKAATTTVPIIFITGSDPVRDGLVASLGRPGGNITGVVFIVSELGTKRLELLRQLVPNATSIGVLVNPNTPESQAERNDLLAASFKIGQQLIVLVSAATATSRTPLQPWCNAVPVRRLSVPVHS